MEVLLVALLATIATTIFGGLLGWTVHWVLHQRWSGFLSRSHMHHHLEQYPPDDLYSVRYRSAGRSSGLLFFTPIITLIMLAILAGLYLLGVPAWVVGLIVVESIVIGLLNEIVHTLQHTRPAWAEGSRWFLRIRALHMVHHYNMKANLGIFWFGWDRMLGTFRDVKPSVPAPNSREQLGVRHSTPVRKQERS